MAETDLNIVLKLVDQASSGLKKAIQDAKKETDGLKDSTDNLKKKSDESTSSLKDGFKKAGKEARDFRQTLLPITIAVGSIIAITKVWAERNQETKESFNKIGDSINTLAGQIGSVFAPAIKSLSDIIVVSTEFLVSFFTKAKEAYKSLAETITFSTQFWVAFFASIKDGQSISDATAVSLKVAGEAAKEIGQSFKESFTENIPNLRESTRAIEQYSDKLKEIQTLFVTGKITASEYFNKLIDLQSQQIYLNQQVAQQFNQLSQIISQVSNTQILEAQRSTQEQINLLNFYKETYMTAHQGMAAFTATVGRSIQTNLSGAITAIATGAKTSKEAFAELGNAMIETIVNFMAQKVIAFALEKTLLAGSVAAASASGAAIAAAYGPAAVAANIATFGAAGVAAAASAAAAGASTVAAMASAGLAGKTVNVSSQMLGGGRILAEGGGGFAVGTPQVPSDMFTNIHKDEMIIPASFSDAIRSGQLTLGGPASKGDSNSYGDINVNVYYPKMNNKEEVQALSGFLGQEILRQLRYARGA